MIFGRLWEMTVAKHSFQISMEQPIKKINLSVTKVVKLKTHIQHLPNKEKGISTYVKDQAILTGSAELGESRREKRGIN